MPHLKAPLTATAQPTAGMLQPLLMTSRCCMCRHCPCLYSCNVRQELALQRVAEGSPEKQRGMEMMNQREMRLKKASRGMAPLLPVCASSMLSMLRMPSVMPGK